MSPSSLPVGNLFQAVLSRCSSLAVNDGFVKYVQGDSWQHVIMIVCLWVCFKVAFICSLHGIQEVNLFLGMVDAEV